MALTFKMTVFLQSLGSRVAKAVTKPFSVPVGGKDTWSDIVTKEFDADAKAHYAFKFWRIMILLRISIAKPPTRFGHT